MRPLFALLFVVLAGSIASAQVSPGRPNGRQGTATARALVDLENGWARGVVQRDTAMFERMLDPKFVYTEDAAVMDKAAVIKSIRDGDRVSDASNSDMVVHDHGETAIVTGILRLRGVGTDRRRFDKRYRFTDVWMRKNGAWRIVAAQDYLIPR
jgi:ketosteroid isomerase-like protein